MLKQLGAALDDDMSSLSRSRASLSRPAKSVVARVWIDQVMLEHLVIA